MPIPGEHKTVQARIHGQAVDFGRHTDGVAQLVRNDAEVLNAVALFVSAGLAGPQDGVADQRSASGRELVRIPQDLVPACGATKDEIGGHSFTRCAEETFRSPGDRNNPRKAG